MNATTSAARIKNALAYVHHWEKNGHSRAEAARDAIRTFLLLSEETTILLNALHVAHSEVAR